MKRVIETNIFVKPVMQGKEAVLPVSLILRGLGIGV